MKIKIHKIFLFVTASLVSTIFADQKMDTISKPFPTVAAQWDFTVNPYLQLKEVHSGAEKLPLDAVALVIHDGKTGELVELMNATGAGSGDVSNSIRNTEHFEVTQRVNVLPVRNNAIVWEIEVKNTSTVEQWIEAGLGGKLNSQNQLKYWDGYLLTEVGTEKVERNTPQLSFPATMIQSVSSHNALVIAMHPENEISWMSNHVDPLTQRYFYGGRFVIPSDEKVRFRFVLYALSPHYAELDAIDGYYQRFPSSFWAKENTDPRLTGFRGINSSYVARYGMGVRNPTNNPVRQSTKAGLGKLYATWDWGYNSHKFSGDWYGLAENWNLPLASDALLSMQEFQNNRSSFDLGNLQNFHEDRQALYQRSDTLANVTQTFFMLNFIQAELAQKNNWMSYTYGYFAHDEQTSGRIKGWVAPYDDTWHIFPWATPFENTFRQALPQILEDLETDSFAVDIFADSAPYRGATTYYLPGWSYDENGKYIDTAIANKRLVEYLHTLTGKSFDAGVVVNLSPWEKDPALYIEDRELTIPNYAAVFKPDAYVVEGDVSNLIDYNQAQRLFPKRYLFGKKYISSVSGAYQDKIGERIPWYILSGNQIRKAYWRYLRKRLMAYYQGGILPNYDDARGIALMVDAIPSLLDVQARGFTAAPASAGNVALQRRRYGDGLGAAIVYSNPMTHDVTSNESIDNRYFFREDKNIVIPFSVEELAFFVEGVDSTKVELRIESMGNAILLFPIALQEVKNTALAGSAHLTQQADRQIYTINVNSPVNQAVVLDVQEPRFFEIESVEVNGEAVDITARIHMELEPENNTIIVTFISKKFLSEEEDYFDFDWSNYQIKIKGESNGKKLSAAEILSTYSSYYQNYTPPIVEESAPNTIPTVIIETNAVRGVFFDSNNPNLLIVSGETDFDTQQLAWDLARLLDSRKNQMPGATFTNPSTKAMLDRIGLMVDAENSHLAKPITDEILQPVEGDDLLPDGSAPGEDPDPDFPFIYPLDREGWSAIASANYIDTGNPVAPEKMLDGVGGTRWTGGKGKAGSWIIVDMGTRQEFYHVQLKSPYPYLYFPLHYKAEVSDNGTHWRNPVLGEGVSKDTDIYWMQKQQARYVRVTLLEDQATFWSVDEFLVFGNPLSPADPGESIDLAATYPLARQDWSATASGNYVDPGNPIAPEKMLDGIAGTRWTAGKGKAGSWIIVDMGMRQEFNHVRLRSPYPYLYFPLHYKAEVSDNGTHWRNPVLGEGVSKDTDIYWMPMQQARYVRVTLLEDQTTFWSVDEFHIFRRPHLPPASP